MYVGLYSKFIHLSNFMLFSLDAEMELRESEGLLFEGTFRVIVEKGMTYNL